MTTKYRDNKVPVGIAELVRLDQSYFLNDAAVKLAVKTYMVASDSYRDPLVGAPNIDGVGIAEAKKNMAMILRAYHLDGLVTPSQILNNLTMQEMRNSDDPAVRNFYSVKSAAK